MRHFYTIVLSFAIFLFCFSCNQKSPETEAAVTPETEELQPPAWPELFQKALQAHGGLDRWQSMQTMQYTVERQEKPERHLIDLSTRKVLLTHENYKVGFDGQEVWVSPDKAAFGEGSARFYHNLRFYFVAMPFVVSDPGINYEVLPQKAIQGKTYDALRITYQSGVGDAPEDEYILHFDPQTHRMEWLLYTVTYYSGKPGERYNALHYSEWQEVNGLWLPRKMVGYRYENDEVGEQRYERLVEDFELATDAPDAKMFMMPAQAEIDSLLKHS